MRYSESLKPNKAFKRLYAKGKSLANPYLAIYYRKNSMKVNHIGITVGVKIGGAVKRNLVRRRIKEAYRINEMLFNTGCDIVVVARVRAGFARYHEIEASLLSLAANLKIRCDLI